ncbi:peptide chain release factor N(5)-glutamine methyltransferase [Propionibacterium sp.]|uniref:peptide chain release factor N(5)-glutamine methyltransferase n=1 Tax=Propionibacterium sp. TaxID=1977903 RepID=UPI0039EB2A58
MSSSLPDDSKSGDSFSRVRDGGERPAAVLRAGIESLSAAGLPTPRADARLLLAHAAGMEPAGLAITRELDADVVNRYRTLLERRAVGEPVQYLTGTAYFRTISVAVGPGVFIPRPETELMVQYGLHHLVVNRAVIGTEPVVVDLGTGSGVIAAAIIAEYPGEPIVYAVENSPEALVWAHRNLAGTSAHLVDTTMGQALPQLDGGVDLVISNPPYLPTGSAELLPHDVVGHDPDAALFSGPDGMDAIRELVPTAERLLKPGGLLVIEHDDSQGEPVVQLLRGTGSFSQVDDHPDLTGRPRFVSATRTQRMGE